ncbi:MAG: ABC transporter ATP-binding protein [Methanobacteriaceae archaeon]
MTSSKKLLEIKEGTFSYQSNNKKIKNSEKDKKYNTNSNIFENISFSIDKGDIFCILGPNGSGKTTLIKCLTGINKLSNGEISVCGKNIKKMTPHDLAKYIGYIPQIHNSTFPYTVLDVVLMGRAPHLDIFESPGEKDIKIAQDAIKSLKIEYLAEKSYNEISGGEQQLVFIARILTQQPKVLILDEPTSHLDFGNQIRTMKIIENLSKAGLAIIMTSHFPDHSFIAGNKVAILKDKDFIDIGSPEKVITEENMKKTYEIPVKIIDIHDRRVCIPLKPD